MSSASTLIIEAARSLEIKKCSLTPLGSMEKFFLSKRINAAILNNNLIREGLIIDVL